MVPKGAGPEEQKRAAELAAIATDSKAFAAALLGNAPDVPIRHRDSQTRRRLFRQRNRLRRRQRASPRAGRRDHRDEHSDAMAKLGLGNSVAVNGDGFGVIREGLSKVYCNTFIESKYGKEVADVDACASGQPTRGRPQGFTAEYGSPLDDYYYPRSLIKAR